MKNTYTLLRLNTLMNNHCAGNMPLKKIEAKDFSEISGQIAELLTKEVKEAQDPIYIYSNLELLVLVNSRSCLNFDKVASIADLIFRLNRKYEEAQVSETDEADNALKTRAAIAHINAHYAKKITLTTAANACHMSKHHFSRTFKKEYGMGFCEYLARYRVEKAKPLLAAGNTSISAIALRVGFGDISNFVKMFRRYTNMSPKEFRNQQ